MLFFLSSQHTSLDHSPKEIHCYTFPQSTPLSPCKSAPSPTKESPSPAVSTRQEFRGGTSISNPLPLNLRTGSTSFWYHMLDVRRGWVQGSSVNSVGWLSISLPWKFLKNFKRTLQEFLRSLEEFLRVVQEFSRLLNASSKLLILRNFCAGVIGNYLQLLCNQLLCLISKTTTSIYLSLSALSIPPVIKPIPAMSLGTLTGENIWNQRRERKQVLQSTAGTDYCKWQVVELWMCRLSYECVGWAMNV